MVKKRLKLLLSDSGLPRGLSACDGGFQGGGGGCVDGGKQRIHLQPGDVAAPIMLAVIAVQGGNRGEQCALIGAAFLAAYIAGACALRAGDKLAHNFGCRSRRC